MHMAYRQEQNHVVYFDDVITFQVSARLQCICISNQSGSRDKPDSLPTTQCVNSVHVHIKVGQGNSGHGVISITSLIMFHGR